MDIRTLTPGHELVEGWLDAMERTSRTDAPYDPPLSRIAKRALLKRPWYGHEVDQLVAVDTGPDGIEHIAGSMQITRPMLDNTNQAVLDFWVVPERRREGIGSALYDAAVEIARADGRTNLSGSDSEPLPDSGEAPRAGSFFAASTGAKAALTEVRRRLDLRDADTGTYTDDDTRAALATEAAKHADGFRVLSWSGRAPEEVVAGMAVLEGRMSTDIPLGDLSWQPEAFDAVRIREMENDIAHRGARWYDTVVIHEETGEVVGLTRLVIDADVPQHAWQWNTIVLPDHRGHRLGTVLKLANLAQMRAAESAIETIDTWNAAENAPMINVNEAMGFRPIDVSVDWEVVV